MKKFLTCKFLFLMLCLSILLSIPAAVSAAKNEIVNQDGFTVYYDKNGKQVKDKFVVYKGNTYYFDETGVMKEDELFKKNGKTYYANSKGVIVKNRFVTLENKRYFFDKDGVRKTGWINYKSHTYYCPKSGAIYKEQWKKIGKYYYYFTSSYYIRKGKWVDGCYVDQNGRKVVQPIEGNGKKKVITMSKLYQNPELPTGCESVALTMVLKYYGFSLSKTTIASSYMSKSKSNFVTAFWGDPFSYTGCGIYSPGLTTTANKYLKAKKSQLRAEDISGNSLESLYQYIDQGIPVIVWNTMQMRSPSAYSTYRTLGKTWTFYQSEHCVVLCGYDKSKKKVLINDPLDGMVWRKVSTFKTRYNQLGKMAVVIK